MKYTLPALFFFCLSIQNTSIAQPSIQWQKSLGGSKIDMCNSVAKTKDGGFVFAGKTFSSNGNVAFNHGDADFWIVKTNNSGGIQWRKSLGGSYADEAVSIEQTSDSGYIVLGNSLSNDGDVSGHHSSMAFNNDYWVARLDSKGNLLWQKSFGGTGAEFATSIKVTNEGGYILAGWSESNDGDVTGNHGGYDGWVVKLDANGNIQWQKSYGGSNTEIINDVFQTKNGGYIIVGGTSSVDGDVEGHIGALDYWVCILDETGAITNQKCFGGSNDEIAFSIDTTLDNSFVIAGRSSSSNGDLSINKGNEDYWIIKVDQDLKIQWKTSYGGNGNDDAYSIKHTFDGGYIVTGFTDSFIGDVIDNHNSLTPDVWVIKLNSVGQADWKKCYGGSGAEYGKSIAETSDRGYIMAGFSTSKDGDLTSNHGDYDYWITKFNSDVVLPLQLKEFSATQVNNSVICSWSLLDKVNTSKFDIQYSTDGINFKIIGMIYYKDLKTQYSYEHADPTSDKNYYRLRITDIDGNYSYSNIVEINIRKNILKIYPNPARQYVIIQHALKETSSTLRIFDISGKLLKSTSIAPYVSQTKIFINDLKPGLYKVQVNDEHFSNLIVIE
ncbi:hypothetical protein BH10BAC2_BH10BAC2_04690 [soil metagenome]